ncbi:MAG TPA: hypothetical protein VGL13_14135 [Polyangiaceae bacterium]
MSYGQFIGRAFRIGTCAAVVALSASPSMGDADKPTKKDKRACAAAFKSGQERQQSGHLREARDQYLACQKAACSKAMRAQCTARYNDLNAGIPSIVPTAADEQGNPRVDVQVTLDGELLTTRLDGQAFLIDPGMHELAFSTTDGGVFATQKLVIAEGQRYRPIQVIVASKRGGKKSLAAATTPLAPIDRSALEPRPTADKTDAESPTATATESTEPKSVELPAAEPPSTSKGGGPGALPYIVGGAGLAAIGAGALFIAWGNNDNDKLGQCAPYCSQGSVDRVSSLYTTANISIGVGAAALGVATYLFLSSGPSKEKPPSRAPYAFDVQPTPSGAFATVSGAF